MNMNKIKQSIKIDTAYIDRLLKLFEKYTNKTVIIKDYQVIFLSDETVIIKFGYIKRSVCYVNISMIDEYKEKYQIAYKSDFESKYNKYIEKEEE